MATKTKIEWTDVTWNPIRGCKEVSPGCENCYAAAMAARFSGPGKPYEGLATFANGKPRWTGDVLVVEKALTEPLRWKKPRRVFVNSMSDLFHKSIPDEVIDSIFAVMAMCPQHTFQILTKRPERMLAYLRQVASEGDMNRWACRSAEMAKSPCAPGIFDDLEWPLPNVWLGVSVEDQERASRIDHLVQTPAAVRFISAEPLLGPLDLGKWISHPNCSLGSWDNPTIIDPPPIDQVIVGGESGPHARPMHPNWARSLRDQCLSAGVPYFFKQWGEWSPRSKTPGTPGRFSIVHDSKSVEVESYPGSFDSFGAAVLERVGKKASGRLLDGREWNEFPEGVKSC